MFLNTYFFTVEICTTDNSDNNNDNNNNNNNNNNNSRVLGDAWRLLMNSINDTRFTAVMRRSCSKADAVQ